MVHINHVVHNLVSFHTWGEAIKKRIYKKWLQERKMWRNMKKEMYYKEDYMRKGRGKGKSYQYQQEHQATNQSLKRLEND